MYLKKLIFIKLLIFFLFLLVSFNLYADEGKNDNTDDYSDLIMEGNDLVIFGTQENSQNMKTIKKEEIEKLNPTDLKDLLKDTCHLNIKSYGIFGSQSTVNVHGMSGERVLILLDGVPLNSKISGQVNLSMIPISNIEEIQIIKGGSDTKYNFSGAIGGVINIITKQNNKPGFKIYSSISNKFYYPNIYYKKPEDDDPEAEDEKKFSEWYDFFDTQRLTLGLGVGNDIVYWDLNAEGNRAFNHFIYKDSDNINRRRTKNEVWDGNIFTNLKFNLPKYMRLYLSGSYYLANKNTPGSINYENEGKRIDHLATASIYYDADMVGHENIDTEFIVNYKYNNLLTCSSTSETDIHNHNSVNIINRWGFIITDWVSLKTGGDFDYNYIDTTNMSSISLFNGGGYLTAEFSILKIAQIIPSVKLIVTNKYPVPIPKLGLVFYIGKYFTLKNNFYRTYRLPTCGELYWPKDDMAEGNPDLIPEDGIGGDIILEYYKQGILSAETAVYVNYIKDIIVWETRKNDVPKAENIGKAFYFGIDNEIKSDFSKYVTLTASYSFLLTYALTDDYKFEDDKRMPYTPMHTFGFGIMINWGSGNLNFIGHYESEKFTSTANTTKLDQHFTLDINFSQKIKFLTIFASVKNAFNSQYFLASGYPMGGGSFTLGVKIDYEGNFNKTGKGTTDEHR